MKKIILSALCATMLPAALYAQGAQHQRLPEGANPWLAETEVCNLEKAVDVTNFDGTIAIPKTE